MPYTPSQPIQTIDMLDKHLPKRLSSTTFLNHYNSDLPYITTATASSSDYEVVQHTVYSHIARLYTQQLAFVTSIVIHCAVLRHP